MRLIVNTNRIIAALIKDSYSRKIIMSKKFELITPEFSKAEIKGHRSEVLKKSKISDAEFDKIFSSLFNKIYVIEDKAIRKKEKPARRIMDHIDPDDSPFIAASLSIENDGIWTDDPHFTKQKSVKVWKTSELVKYF